MHLHKLPAAARPVETKVIDPQRRRLARACLYPPELPLSIVDSRGPSRCATIRHPRIIRTCCQCRCRRGRPPPAGLQPVFKHVFDHVQPRTPQELCRDLIAASDLDRLCMTPTHNRLLPSPRGYDGWRICMGKKPNRQDAPGEDDDAGRQAVPLPHDTACRRLRLASYAGRERCCRCTEHTFDDRQESSVFAPYLPCEDQLCHRVRNTPTKESTTARTGKNAMRRPPGNLARLRRFRRRARASRTQDELPVAGTTPPAAPLPDRLEVLFAAVRAVERNRPLPCGS